MAHTPGPWEVEETDDGHLIRMGSALTNHAQYEVHHAINYDHGLDGHYAETEAERSQCSEAQDNAYLIAAAPDLLEAAKRLVDCYTNPAGADQHEDCWAVLESAIAKAEVPPE